MLITWTSSKTSLKQVIKLINNSYWCSPFSYCKGRIWLTCCYAPPQWCGALNGSGHGMSVVFRGTMQFSVHIRYVCCRQNKWFCFSPVGLICSCIRLQDQEIKAWKFFFLSFIDVPRHWNTVLINVMVLDPLAAGRGTTSRVWYSRSFILPVSGKHNYHHYINCKHCCGFDSRAVDGGSASTVLLISTLVVM